jgi:hypothetical protein
MRVVGHAMFIRCYDTREAEILHILRMAHRLYPPARTELEPFLVFQDRRLGIPVVPDV